MKMQKVLTRLVLPLFFLTCNAAAFASTNKQGLEMEGPIDKIVNLITGPFAFLISLGGIIGGIIGVIMGGELNGIIQTLIKLVLGIAILTTAVNILNFFFNLSGAVIR